MASSSSNLRMKTFIAMVVGVSALALFVFFFKLGYYRTLTTHEAFLTAVPAREMLATGDWLVPRFGGIPILTRPPLGYWVLAALGWFSGEINEWVARLPAALSGLALVWLVGFWGSRWYGRTVGVCAALVQSTSVYMIIQARLAEVDMLLGLLTTSALFLAAQSVVGRPAAPGSEPERREPSWISPTWIGVYLLLGLSALAKEFIGPIMGLMPVVLFLIVEKRSHCLWHLANPIGLLCFFAFALAWPLRVGSEFPEMWEIWHGQTVARAFGAWDHEPFWFYGVTVPWLILPWTPITIAAAIPSWNAALKAGDERERFLWIWFLSHVFLLSLSVGKHKHHVIPALPALSLITAQGLDRLITRMGESREPLLTSRQALYGWLLWPAVTLATALVVVNKWPELAPSAVATALLCGIGGGVAIGFFRSGRGYAALVAVLGVFLAGYIGASGWLIPGRDPRRAAVEFTRAAASKIPAGKSIVVYGMGWTPVFFYLTEGAVREETLQGLKRRLGTNEGIYVLTERIRMNELKKIADVRQLDVMGPATESYLRNSPRLILAHLTQRGSDS